MANEDQVKGTLKEAEGKLTDDKTREAEGKAEGAWGDIKEHASDLKDDLADRK
jgi:uncharacterized protein YjbJ (UPF0337 family)